VGGAVIPRPGLRRVEQRLADTARAAVGVDHEVLDPRALAEAHGAHVERHGAQADDDGLGGGRGARERLRRWAFLKPVLRQRSSRRATSRARLSANGHLASHREAMGH